MARKSDSCIYYHYFGEYGMDLCDHPSREGHRELYKGGCKGCKLKQTQYGGIDRCPFCGCRAKVLPAMGHDTIRYKWKIMCDGCGATIHRMSASAAIIAWNHREGGVK